MILGSSGHTFLVFCSVKVKTRAVTLSHTHASFQIKRGAFADRCAIRSAMEPLCVRPPIERVTITTVETYLTAWGKRFGLSRRPRLSSPRGRKSPSGELLTILLDVTLPALFQDSAGSRQNVYNGARKAKANAYPHKDSEGRRNNPSPCLPLILTSMGGLCSEGHEFIRLCRSREQAAADHMIDVLVTQHSRWTARRIHRALFGQSLIDFGGGLMELRIQSGRKSKDLESLQRQKVRHADLHFEQVFSAVHFF